MNAIQNKTIERSWLKEIRLKKSLLQRNIAEDADISVALYSLIETGQRDPSPATAIKIAEILGFPWTLFYEKNKK